MRGPRATRYGALLGLTLAVACRPRDPGAQGVADAAASASAAPATSASTPAPTRETAKIPAPPPPTPFGCRVLGVKSATPAPPGTPAVGTLLRGDAWVDVAAGVELSLKHGETTRELKLRGPGRFLACTDGDESVLVASGSVDTTPGPGSRAGAEVMLATPFGVVQYGDARLTLDVSEGKLALAVKQGAATLAAAGADTRAATAPPKEIVAPRGHATLASKVDTAALAARCVEARQKLTGPTQTRLPISPRERGEWAKNMLEMRKAVRLDCARARAAAGRLEGAARSALEAQLGGRKASTPSVVDAGTSLETDAGK